MGVNNASLYNVMTRRNKEVLINIRVGEITREEFRIAAELRGSTMSNLVHQFVVKTIREEKERSPEAFEGIAVHGGEPTRGNKINSTKSAQEVNQQHLFSRGTVKKSTKSEAAAVRKDLADIKEDARKRVRGRKKG